MRSRLKLLITFFILSQAALSKRERIESKFFSIIYEEGLEEEALNIKNMEDKAEELFSLVTYPEHKIEVYILDSNIENAIVPPFKPYKIILWANDWKTYRKNYSKSIEMTFMHELTHSIFGIYSKKGRPFYNLLVPRWLHEGIAIYMETKFFNGRGNMNDFLNIPKSCTHCKYPNFKRLPYEHGFGFVKFLKDKYSEEVMIKMVKEAYMRYFFHETVWKKDIEEWQNTLVLKEPLEKKFVKELSNTISFSNPIKESNDKIYFVENSAHKTIKEFDPKTREVKSIKEIFGLVYFQPGEKISYIKSIGTKENIACMKDRYDESILNPRILSDKLNIYVNREKAKERLIQNGKVLISESEGFLFFTILEYRERIFLELAYVDKPGRFLAELKDNTIHFIDEALHCSLKDEKIYYVKDKSSGQAAYEYNIEEGELFELFESNIILYPLRIEERIYFLSFENCKGQIFSSSIKRDPVRVNLKSNTSHRLNSSTLHFNEEDQKESENRVNEDILRQIKECHPVVEKDRLTPLYALPIIYPTWPIGISAIYLFFPEEVIPTALFDKSFKETMRSSSLEVNIYLDRFKSSFNYQNDLFNFGLGCSLPFNKNNKDTADKVSKIDDTNIGDKNIDGTNIVNENSDNGNNSNENNGRTIYTSIGSNYTYIFKNANIVFKPQLSICHENFSSYTIKFGPLFRLPDFKFSLLYIYRYNLNAIKENKSEANRGQQIYSYLVWKGFELHLLSGQILERVTIFEELNQQYPFSLQELNINSFIKKNLPKRERYLLFRKSIELFITENLPFIDHLSLFVKPSFMYNLDKKIDLCLPILLNIDFEFFAIGISYYFNFSLKE